MGNVTTATESTDRFLRDVREGLSRSPKSLPSFYIYDERGSELFRQIMELEEYYLTRTERRILEQQGNRMLDAFHGLPCDVVDLGAGDGLKTRVLLNHLRNGGATPRYIPVDVSQEAVTSAIEQSRQAMPWLDAEGVAAEYTDALRWLAAQEQKRRQLVLFLGSNLGNLDHDQACAFLRRLRKALNPGDCLLIGFDMVKDPELLERAYDDASGVTARFNLNLLHRINRELGANFRIDAFRHYSRYAALEQRIESCLLSCEAQTVTIGGENFSFEPWEPIHTEISCKYRAEEISEFARVAGFVEVGQFTDERSWFADALWRVPNA